MKQYLIFVLLICTIMSCEKVENFENLDTPRFYGEYSDNSDIEASDEITVVSFNIEYAIRIDEAIEEIKNNENLNKADFILLQEMDEIGAEKISESLFYDYLFYPSNRNSEGQLFGLAILSKWPILNDEKILLPHSTPLNNRKRIAVTALVDVGGKSVRIYNIHPATLSVPKAHRREQFETIMHHLENLNETTQQDHVIIGGDFNTDKQIDIDYLVTLYKEHQLTWVSENVGPTWQKFSGLAKYTLDHLFSKGFTLKEAGKAPSSLASDHLPIWVSLSFEE